jgi:hypothetical protein
VVAGGADQLIADQIYLRRNAGCGMLGNVSQTVLQPDGTLFTAYFDRPTAEPLYISFDVTQVVGMTAPDETYIRNQILSQLSYKIGQSADTTSITSLIYSIDPNASVSNIGVSTDNVTYVPLLAVTNFNYQFTISSSRIIINGNAGP